MASEAQGVGDGCHCVGTAFCGKERRESPQHFRNIYFFCVPDNQVRWVSRVPPPHCPTARTLMAGPNQASGSTGRAITSKECMKATATALARVLLSEEGDSEVCNKREF